MGVISLGLGSPASIGWMLTFGLSSAEPAEQVSVRWISRLGRRIAHVVRAGL
jgi:hypothetical protein